MALVEDVVVADNPAHGCGPLLVEGNSFKPLRQQIFEYIRSRGRTSRIEISKKLEISPATVTALTNELLELSYIRERKQVEKDGARGRPKVTLEVEARAKLVVGMKLGDFGHSAVLTDFSGHVLAEIQLPSEKTKKQPEVLVDEADELLRRLCAAASTEIESIDSVGIGISGMVNHDAGEVPWTPLLHGRDIKLRSLLSARLGLPIHIDNDANVLTLAELWFGSGRARSSFAVVTIENGVGMGFVIDNRLYRGAEGLGLELGHTKVQLDGALCRCGKRGCLEAYVADYALIREARTALDLAPDSSIGNVKLMLENLYEQAKAGNEEARTIFRRAGRYLAMGLCNVSHIFDPNLILLSGERMRYDYLYADDVIAEMANMSLDKGRAPPRVETHEWGQYVWPRGAAALALESLTDQVFNA